MIDRRAMLRQGALLGAGLALAGPTAILAAEDPRLRFVHPELREIAAKGLEMNFKPMTAENLAELRKSGEAGPFQKPQRKDISVERRTIPGRAGQPEVTVFVINSQPGTLRPAILHTHGGGYVAGRAVDGVPDLQELAADLECVIVTVDYRLAPETTWKGSLEDNYAGLKWLHDNAEALGVDVRRIAIAGESAGGGHAALLAIATRDRGEVPVVFQCLTYPMLDDRTGSSRSVAPHVGKLFWTDENNRFGWQSFLGMPPGGSKVPVAAVPGRQANLAGLPPAFIGVGSIDLFVDEDIAYAKRLNEGGVPVQLVVVPGAFHGFDIFAAHTRISTWFNNTRREALRAALAPAGA